MVMIYRKTPVELDIQKAFLSILEMQNATVNLNNIHINSAC